MNDEVIPLRWCFGPGPLLSVLLAAVVAPADVRGQDAEPRPSPQSVQSANPRTSLATGYAVDSGSPTRSTALDWGAVAGIAIGRDGEIWTFHRGEEPVRVFSPSGELLRSWGRGEFREPHQLRIDGGGNVWLVDSRLHVVRKYSSKCELMLTLGTKGVAGDDPAHFNRPTDVAVAPSGDVFVADGYSNNRIVHFDASGNFVKSWGELGVAPGKLNLPHSIAVDSKGRLYVADRNNVRIQVFDQSGRLLDEWRGLLVPWHIVVTEADELYVCGSSPMRWPRLPIPGLIVGIPPKDQLVMVFDPDGRAKRLWTFPKGTRPGELDWVHALAVDRRGNLYLGDIQGRRPQRFLRLEPGAPN